MQHCSMQHHDNDMSRLHSYDSYYHNHTDPATCEPVMQVQQHDIGDRRAAQSAYQSHADRLALPPGSAVLSIEDVQRAIDDRARGRQPGAGYPGIPEAPIIYLYYTAPNLLWVGRQAILFVGLYVGLIMTQD